MFSECFAVPEGRKSRLAKAMGGEPLGGISAKKCPRLWRKLHSHSKCSKGSQTSDVWTDAATEVRTVKEEKELRKREPVERRSERTRKGRKVAKNLVFPIFWSSGGSKRRLARAAGSEPFGRITDQKLHAAAKRSRF